MSDAEGRSAPPEPSATVVVLRDASPGPEVLLLQRAPRRDGRPGAWVFPGGKVEPGDRIVDSEPEVARRAAVRETLEEAGLDLEPHGLAPISRWITPEIAPRRFDTWFFLGVVGAEHAVRVDGGEIVNHRWLPAASALESHHAGELALAPPTFVTVTWMSRFARAAEAHATLSREPLVTFRPNICRIEGGACILYPGDAGYERSDPDASGSRHRLWSLVDGYRYERS